MSMQAPDNLPPPILTNGSNDFAYDTMRVRHVQMIQKVLDANPNFPAVIREDLMLLKEDLQNNAPIPMLNLYPSPTPDYIEWASAYIERRTRFNPTGQPLWLGVDWLFAETMLFRTMMEMVRWWELRADPFLPIKAEELKSGALWEMLEAALMLEGGVLERLPALVKFAAWGNRIDLSYAESMQHGTDAHDDDLIIDHSYLTRDHMLRAQLAYFPSSEQGIAHIIIDNAGTELAMDLALTDALLTGFSDVVILHTKYHPTFVSDATAEDVRHMIEQCAAGDYSDVVTAMGERLQMALYSGRLRLAPHLFWNSAMFLWEMPQALERVFENAQIVVLKGDANYRRAVGDAIWNPTTPFEQIVSYFPSPLLALRTLKSDPVVGLPEGMSVKLSREDARWRVNGKRAVAQLKV